MPIITIFTSSLSSQSFCYLFMKPSGYLFMKPSGFLFSSVQFSCSVVSNSLWPHGLQHARLPCPSTTPGACSNLCPLSQWCHPTISSSVVPFSSCLQSFPASRSLQMSQLFTFIFSISLNEYSGLISFRMDWLDLLAFQGTVWVSPVFECLLWRYGSAVDCHRGRGFPTIELPELTQD